MTHAPPRDLPLNLALPLESGEPSWYFVGGRVSVDFVNTLRERWWRRVESLVTPRDLERWLQRVGLLSSSAAAGDGAVESARVLREAVDAAFAATLDGRTPPLPALATLNAWLPHALAPPCLALRGGELALVDSPARDEVALALGRIALDAAQIIAEPRARRRLRTCASDTCSARFFDNSPAGRRQWCSMRTCGNVAKARRYRARHTHDQPQEAA
jgi:predicted RNA-binding Zn ribbon-like protein